MTYNHNTALKKWTEEKEKEEVTLRENQVPEIIIKELYDYDYADFKKDRNFHENESVTRERMFIMQVTYPKKEMLTIENMLDEIENEALFEYMKNVDKTVLMIILMKLNDYDIKEIAEELNMSPNAIYKRIKNFRKKLPK